MAGGRISRRLSLLHQALALDADERDKFLAEHVELFAEQYLASLAAAVAATTTGSTARRLRALLVALGHQSRHWQQHAEAVTLGGAPYEVLFRQVRMGAVDQAAAQRAAAAATDPAEAEPYLRALLALSRRMQPAMAVVLLGIVRAAVAARPGGVWADQTGPRVQLQFVRATGRHLVDEADGRLLRAAAAAGAAVLAEADQRGDRDLVVEAQLALGSLWSDPYTARRSSRDLDVEIHRWQRRFWDRHRAELATVDPGHWQMPEPADSLRRGVTHYRAAAEHLTGHDRGLALKAVFLTLGFLQILGDPVDRAELTSAGQEAVALIDPRLAPGQLLTALAYLTALDEPVDLATLDQLLAGSVDQQLRDHGPDEALDVALNAVPLLCRVAPQRAEAAAARARPLVALLDHSWARARQWANELQAFVAGHVPGGFDGLPDGPLAAAAAAVVADADEHDPVRPAAALLGLAMRSPATDEEATGLDLLDQVQQLVPAWSLEHRQALQFEQASLVLGTGVNAVDAGDWSPAIDAYATALDSMCELGLPEATLDVLARIDDLVARSGQDGAVSAVVAIATVAARAEALGGEAATRYVQHICQQAVAVLAAGGPTNPEALLVVLQAAKGLRFANLLLSRGRFRWSEDDEGHDLLEQLAEAAEAVPGGGEPGPADLELPIDDALVLAGQPPPVPAAAAERVLALRRAYDQHLTRRLLGGSRPEDLVFLGSKDLRRAIDERTVLIDLYLGVDVGGRVALYSVAVTTDGMSAAATVLATPAAELDAPVAQVRRALLEPSEPDDVSDEARAMLDAWLHTYLRGVWQWLPRWRAEGRDHLCVVPHGPLHVLPFHLIRHEGRPLAEDWAVTVLPSHALLLDERGGATTATRRRRTVTALGLSYPPGNRHGLPPLRHARREAQAVAAVFGTEPILDEAATEERFVEALVDSRFVHLAAHGRYDEAAPSFHCVYLTPGAGSDGRLRAYEITSLDLRGTELVTLSACETTLGGVDFADNPSGLSAALLLAGVRAIVGTLWQVRSDTAGFFFTELYREIRLGTPRHYAFWRAQRRTRERFPVYRDWGAFCFLGGWQ